MHILIPFGARTCTNVFTCENKRYDGLVDCTCQMGPHQDPFQHLTYDLKYMSHRHVSCDTWLIKRYHILAFNVLGHAHIMIVIIILTISTGLTSSPSDWTLLLYFNYMYNGGMLARVMSHFHGPIDPQGWRTASESNSVTYEACRAAGQWAGIWMIIYDYIWS